MLNLFSLCNLFQDSISQITNLWESTGIYALFGGDATWQNLVMLLISFVLVYLAVVKKFEPLLLLPIAFGMFIINIPGSYRILFGEKGYIITDNVANAEVARGSLEQILALFKVESLTELNTLLAGSEQIVLSTGAIYNAQTMVNGELVQTLSISNETVIDNFGLFYYIYKGVDWVIFPPKDLL